MVLGSNTSGHLFDTTFTTNGVAYSAASGVLSNLTAATNGQVIIGNTGSAPTVGSIGSSDSSITWTVGAGTLTAQVSGGTTVGKTITGDTGGALSPTSGNWNLLGTGSITTSGSGSSLTTQLTGLTNHALLVGAGTATITKVGPTATAGQYLQSAGSSADPVFSTATLPSTATGTGTLLRADGTNWVATTSTYPNTNAVSTLLYASSANVMAALTTANNGTLVTSATGVPSILAGPGTTGNILQSNAAAAPSFSTATYPSSTTINQVLYSSSNNVVAGITAANNGTLISGTTGIPSWLANGTTGQVLTATTSSPPSWGTAPFTQATVQKVTATGNFTYTPTSGMKYVIVELVGGGGGGGGSPAAGAGNDAVGGGGGSGVYVRFILTAAQVGSSLSGSVGAGGGGGSGGASGTNGNDTTLSTSATWTAGGGVGGNTSAAGATAIATGGAGGTLTSGTGTLIVNSGSGGGSGFSVTTLAQGGIGGFNPLGEGGAPGPRVAAGASNGNGGGNYGGGGSGATTLGNTASTGTGGAGANGIAIFTEFV